MFRFLRAKTRLETMFSGLAPVHRALGGSVARWLAGPWDSVRGPVLPEPLRPRGHTYDARVPGRAPPRCRRRAPPRVPERRPRRASSKKREHESTRRHLRGLAGAGGAGPSAGVAGAREGKGGAACAARHARALALLGLVRRAHRPQQRCLHREARWQSERPRDAQSWRARAGGFEWTHGAPAARYRRP